MHWFLCSFHRFIPTSNFCKSKGQPPRFFKRKQDYHKHGTAFSSPPLLPLRGQTHALVNQVSANQWEAEVFGVNESVWRKIKMKEPYPLLPFLAMPMNLGLPWRR